jgi:hypothetical protein
MNYQKIYENIIEKAKLENRQKGNGTYYENHHIQPRCLEGGNDEKNLVLLTAKEHFISHKLLTKIYVDRNINIAFWFMCYSNKKGRETIKISSRDYAYAKELRNLLPVPEETKIKISEANKGRIKSSNECENIRQSKLGNKNPMFGKKLSEETKKKMSESHKGQMAWNKGIEFSDETRKKMSISGKIKIFTEDHKKKISLSHKNREKVICEHCDKELFPQHYKRWHGDKCKLNKNIEKDHGTIINENFKRI